MFERIVGVLIENLMRSLSHAFRLSLLMMFVLATAFYYGPEFIRMIERTSDNALEIAKIISTWLNEKQPLEKSQKDQTKNVSIIEKRETESLLRPNKKKAIRYQYMNLDSRIYTVLSPSNLRRSPNGTIVSEVNPGIQLIGTGRVARGPTVNWIELQIYPNRTAWIASYLVGQTADN